MTTIQTPRQLSDRTPFLVFSDDWGVHPSSCQHLFRHIAKTHKVLWVNTIGMRNPKPTFADFGKAVSKIARMFRGRDGQGNSGSIENGVVACQPFMLPFANWPGVRRFNTRSVVRKIRESLARLGLDNPILVTTVPNACDYVGKCGERKVIYYCVDDFSEWPGLEKDLVLRMEEDLIRKSDIMIATSEKLYRKLSTCGKPTFLLTHGVDVEFFGQEVAAEHPLLNTIPKPRVGYFGLYDDRSDHELLSEVAQRMPDFSFVITGKVESDSLRQKRIPNIYFTGAIPYGELPAMVKGWEALMLPYVINELTEAISPLKLKEYLATGKPIVSTPVPEVLKLKEYVIIAETAELWEGALRTSLLPLENGMEKPSSDFWKNETWGKKANRFLSNAQA